MNTKKLTYLSMPFELKASDAEDPDYYYIEGYGSTFGNVDLGKDVVLPGAFTKSLKTRMPKMVYQHNMSNPIGVWDEATEDRKGLKLKGRLPKANRQVQDIMSLMKMGAIDSLSIGFQIAKGGAEIDDKGIRNIKAVDLYEVSPVTMPMNPDAKLNSVKSFSVEDVEEITTKRELEELLIDAGFSKKAALCIIRKLSVKLGEPDALVDDQTDEEQEALEKSQREAEALKKSILQGLTAIKKTI